MVSILLAFGVDALWDRAQDREREEGLLQAVQQDMLGNREEVRLVLAASDAFQSAYLTWRVTPPEQLAELPRDSADELLRDLRALRTFSGFRGAMLTSDLSIIRDPELRAALGAWIAQAGNVEEDTFHLVTSLRDARASVDPQSWRWLEVQENSAEALASLRRNHAYMLALHWKRSVVAVNRGKVEDLGSLTDEILRLIAANLD